MTAQLAAQLQDALGANYRIEQELDGGGMSRLFVATQLELTRRVVIKVLPPDLTTEMSVARFKREIDLTVRLQHPNILPVLTAGSMNDTLYYVTPYMPGESLRARIEREGKMPLDDVVRILHEAGEALAYAHGRGVVHRDVKPANILLSEGHAILADFGIARALGSSGAEGSLTGSGMRPGTPAYMAPELPSDEGADVYSLGVVGYEMLAGRLPRRGVTAKEIIAARGTVAGDTKAAVRRIADVLAKALEMAPERRLATTAEFTTALVAPARARTMPVWPVAAAAAALLVAVGVWQWRHSMVTATVDRSPYLVAPFSGANGALATTVTRRISDAFGEWQGVSVIDEQRVRDAFANASPSQSLESIKSIARRLAAHTVVLGEVERAGDSVVIRVAQYGVSDSTPARPVRVAYASASDTSATAAIRRVVNTLLRTGAELPWRNARDTRRPVLASWTAYDRGRVALDHWDLHGAQRAFDEAIDADPRNSRAHLWLAQTLVWANRDSAGQLRSVARKALNGRADLDAHDTRLATALWALVDSQYVEACHGFRQMIAGDSTDLAGWIGLGDCQRRDGAVVASARSPSGWAFRGSFADAARAYLRAGEIAPSTVDPAFRGWLMTRLNDVLYTTTNHMRAGPQLGPTRLLMYGAPFLSGDSIAFAPVPLSDVVLGKSAVPSDLVDAAIARNLGTLRHAAEQWVLRAPTSSAAYANLTSLAEATGGFAYLGETRISALDAARRAQFMSTDSAERFRLSIVQARLLVKTEQFDAARKTADSVLSVAQGQSTGSAELAGLAILLGRPAQAAQLMDEHNTSPRIPGRSSLVDLPPAVLKVRLHLLAYAAMGGPSDSVHALALRADAAVRSYFTTDSVADEARTAVMATSLSLVFPREADLLRAVSTNERVIRAEQLTLTDRAAAATLLRDIIRGSRGHAPGQAMDGPYRMATVALTLGDTAAAIAVLDRALGALPTIGDSLFDQVAQVGSLVRAMAVRAEIAAARGDAATASRWARAVATLLSKAEPALQPLANRMKMLASSS